MGISFQAKVEQEEAVFNARGAFLGFKFAGLVSIHDRQSLCGFPFGHIGLVPTRWLLSLGSQKRTSILQHLLSFTTPLSTPLSACWWLELCQNKHTHTYTPRRHGKLHIGHTK